MLRRYQYGKPATFACFAQNFEQADHFARKAGLDPNGRIFKRVHQLSEEEADLDSKGKLKIGPTELL